MNTIFEAIYQITYPEPKRILKSGPVTIVFWNDDTKTIVRPEPGIEPDDYAAFTAALGKKVYGSNSRIKRMLAALTEVQEGRK
jgi:hypothetical protein